MAIKTIDVREDPDNRDEITETRYTFDDDGDYWMIDAGGIIAIEASGNHFTVCAQKDYQHFFAMIKVLEQEIIMQKLKETNERASIIDDVPF